MAASIKNSELKYHSDRPKSSTRQLVVFLHGYGADGSDLISLAPYFRSTLPDALFVSPDAPFPCEMAPYGLQWFSLVDRSEEAMLKGLEIASAALNKFLDVKLEELGLSDSNLMLIGFSQGTMLSLHTAFRRKDKMAGILGYSGALVAPNLLKKQMVSKPQVCLIHGEADNVVPFEAMLEANKSLTALGVSVSAYSREGLGHGIDPAGIKLGNEFVRTCFDV